MYDKRDVPCVMRTRVAAEHALHDAASFKDRRDKSKAHVQVGYVEGVGRTSGRVEKAPIFLNRS